MLSAQLHVLLALAHDRETVGSDVNGGQCPGGAAPALVVHRSYVPLAARVELTWQVVWVVDTAHRVHAVDLQYGCRTLVAEDLS